MRLGRGIPHGREAKDDLGENDKLTVAKELGTRLVSKGSDALVRRIPLV
jgi:hypothetical protein